MFQTYTAYVAMVERCCKGDEIKREPRVRGPGDGLRLRGGVKATLHLSIVVHHGLRPGVDVGLQQL
jgi:hypothetical protein